MIQVLIVADRRHYIQRICALLEHYEDLILNVAFHSTDIFDAYLQYAPDVILIDPKIQLPLPAILEYFEARRWDCLFFIEKNPDFLVPTPQTVFIDLEQDNLYLLIQKYLHDRRHSQPSAKSLLNIISPDGRDILKLGPDLYFIMMCISLSADEPPLGSDTVSQLKNAVKTVGNCDIFRILERDIVIVMRKSQMNPSIDFNEVYSIVCCITKIPYSAVRKDRVPLEALESTCQSILSASERCYCLGPKCFTMQEIDTMPLQNDVFYFYSLFVQMMGCFFEHDLKSFTACIRNFYTGQIISAGNPIALECLHEWLSFAEDTLFRKYVPGTAFSYACIYGSAEQECQRILEHWSQIYFRYDRLPYRPATIQALYCLLQNYSEPGFSLDEASRKIRFSKTYTSRFIKEDIDQSFGDLLLRLRMQHSCILLKMTSVTVKDIALAVGYGDAQYFSKVFKKQTHMQPTDFRQHFQKRRQP